MRRRRRLRLERLARRELLAVGDFCLADPSGTVFNIETDADLLASVVAKSGESIDAEPTVSIGDATMVEGNAGETLMRFNVTLSETSSETITVDVTTADDTATALSVRRLASGLSLPVYATAPAGDTSRLFVVEQRGEIEILNLPDGSKNGTPFLSLSGLSDGSEQGLLGLAFHPDYATNGYFYVYFTDGGGDSVIRRYQVSGDADVADPASGQTVLTFDQPFTNHNGGWIGFGPDGYLYVGSGDGGSGNDPQGNAQDITDNLLGKMLRLDVDGDDFPFDADRNHAIPPDNPFVGVSGDDEIWAYGLRNPWRSSFDRDTGDLYIGDVGQRDWEEINVQPASSAGGENYGWRLREGTRANPASVGGPKPAGAIDPVYEYLHGSGDLRGYSVTGGYVYRGPIEELQGQYFFADYVSRRIWSLRFDGDDPSSHDGTNYTDFVDWTDALDPEGSTINSISSFAEDALGNLYVIDRGGEVFMIESGADYRTTSATIQFDPGDLVQPFEVAILGDRLTESDETLTATLSGPVNTTLGDAVAVGTIEDDEPRPPTVESVVINDGSDGRSQITSVTVLFDTEVTTGAGAFVLTNLDTSQPVSGISVDETVVAGQTLAVLTFTPGDSVVDRQGAGPLGDSLADGAYRLDVVASQVHSVEAGMEMAADHSFGETPTDNFFRRFGDQNGSGTVELFDFVAFRSTYLRSEGAGGFNAAMDVEGNGTVNIFDFVAFRSNYGA